MEKLICGIQQMGIGVPDVEEVWAWYRKYFGLNVKVFQEAAEAPLMIDYTGGKVQSRTATLAMNMQGGGGFEIWQYTSRNTEKPTFDIQLGDLGIYVTRIKSKDVEATYKFYKEEGVNLIGELNTTPNGSKHFFVKDPNGNLFNVVDGNGWLLETGALCGGVAGAMIGVSDIENSLKLYKDVLGYDTIEYDETGVFEDFNGLAGGSQKVRRVLLSHQQKRKGPFSELLGPSKIELVQVFDREQKKIFENRYWGDWGFIHLCFDIKRMDKLKKECEEKGFPFTVDSGGTFDMGEAGGQFSYIEDPDGTLIEFVETHKIPIVKKIGWYLDLRKRDHEKSLPRFIFKAIKWSGTQK